LGGQEKRSRGMKLRGKAKKRKKRGAIALLVWRECLRGSRENVEGKKETQTSKEISYENVTMRGIQEPVKEDKELDQEWHGFWEKIVEMKKTWKSSGAITEK